MKRKILSLCLAVMMVLNLCGSAMAYDTSAVQESEPTLGSIQECVRVYLEAEHPDIIVGSEEYIHYLSAQLMEEADKNLQKCRNIDRFGFMPVDILPLQMLRQFREIQLKA